MPTNFVVSVHIPKTAGTTLANVFSRCFNRRVIFDYDGYANPAKVTPLIASHSDFISTYFSVLHGHFFAKKYFSVFADAHFISTVRHPVERVISQYVHELNEESSDAWYHDDIASGRMDLPTFAAQPGIGDAMSVHLAGRPLPSYSLLLVSEQLRLSLALFDKLIQTLNLEQHFGSPVVLPLENLRSSRKRAPEITETHRRAVFDRTQRDNEIYTEAFRLLEAKAATLLA